MELFAFSNITKIQSMVIYSDDHTRSYRIQINEVPSHCHSSSGESHLCNRILECSLNFQRRCSACRNSLPNSYVAVTSKFFISLGLIKISPMVGSNLEPSELYPNALTTKPQPTHGLLGSSSCNGGTVGRKKSCREFRFR